MHNERKGSGLVWHCIAFPQRLQDLLFIHRGSMKKSLPRTSGGEFAAAVVGLLAKAKVRATRCHVMLPMESFTWFTCLDRSKKESMPNAKRCQSCYPTKPAAKITTSHFRETRPMRPASLHHLTENFLSEPIGFHRLRNTMKRVRHT